MTNDSLKENM